MGVQHHRFKAWCFIFILSLLIHQNSAIEASSNIEDLDLYERVSKIEAKDRHQDGEIYLLKNALDEEKKLVHDLTSRLTILEDSNKLVGRPKRPVRLLPPHILRGPERNKTDADAEKNRRFYGPATGCNDLGRLGYTLNGYYLVHGNNNQSSNSSSNITNQIEVVECRFRQISKTDNQTADDKERRLGFIRLNNENNSNNGQTYSDKEQTCLYELKTWIKVCLVAEDRVIKKKNESFSTTNLGSYLVQKPCESVKEEQQWKRKDKHICSNKNDKCLTVSPNSQHGSLFVNLMAYEESDLSQQWVINVTKDGLLIRNVGTSLCLNDPAYEKESKISTKARTTLNDCEIFEKKPFSYDFGKYFSSYLFFFDPVNSSVHGHNCQIKKKKVKKVL